MAGERHEEEADDKVHGDDHEGDEAGDDVLDGILR